MVIGMGDRVCRLSLWIQQTVHLPSITSNHSIDILYQVNISATMVCDTSMITGVPNYQQAETKANTIQYSYGISVVNNHHQLSATSKVCMDTGVSTTLQADRCMDTGLMDSG